MRSHLCFALDAPEALGIRELPDLFIARVHPVARLVPTRLAPSETGNGCADAFRDFFVAREFDVVAEGASSPMTPPSVSTQFPQSLARRSSRAALPVRTLGGAGLFPLKSLLLQDSLFRPQNDSINPPPGRDSADRQAAADGRPGPLLFLRTVLPAVVLRASASFRRLDSEPCRGPHRRHRLLPADHPVLPQPSSSTRSRSGNVLDEVGLLLCQQPVNLDLSAAQITRPVLHSNADRFSRRCR